MSEYFVISRKWKNPQIIIEILGQGLEVKMSIDNFISTLKEEIGSVATTFTKSGMDEKIDMAISNIIESMKKETEQVALNIPIDLV